MHWNPAVGVPMLIVGLVALALIWLFGQPRKPGQGRRQSSHDAGREPAPRREPTLGPDPTADAAAGASHDPGREPVQTSLLDSDDDAPSFDPEPEVDPGPDVPIESPARHSGIGRRPGDAPMERIVTLNVVAVGGGRFQGADLVVAADKAGLEFGHKAIFHRQLEGKSELGPVFSVANMLQPGSFDLGHVAELTTTGLSFFMTLPGPLPALDAWDAMLPTAQRMAELLGGQVLDDAHNALGRQRIAHIRDELRAWDRAHQGGLVDFDS